MASNKSDKHYILKILFFALALVLAYLFALNGRYIKVDYEVYFDKWTRQMIIIDREKIIR